MPTILPWPAKGDWLLANPKSPVGHNKDGWYRKADPPFATLEVNFKTHSGTIRQWKTTAPISNIKLRQTADGPKFSADYAIGGHRGQFEATVGEGYELEIDFTGTAVTNVNAHPTTIEQGDTAKDDPGPPPTPRVSISCAGDIAKWFDSLVEENNHEVEAWARTTIAKHPDAWWAVGLAKTVYDVPVVLGQGMVDALRLGEGTGAAIWQDEGGWGVAKGIGQDGLRLLQFIPAFKALKLVKTAGAEAHAVGTEARVLGAEARTLGGEARAVATEARPAPTMPAPAGGTAPQVPRPPYSTEQLVKVYDPGLGICTWVGVTQAVRIVKCTTYFTVARLMKLASAANVPIRAVSIAELKPVLTNLGLRLRPLLGAIPKGTSAEAITSLAKAERNGVVLFEVYWDAKVIEEGKEVVKQVGHTMTAYNSPTSGMVIIDRSARDLDTIVRRVADLECSIQVSRRPRSDRHMYSKTPVSN